jgi:hypothetical protein
MMPATKIHNYAIEKTTTEFGITADLIETILDALYTGQELDPGAKVVADFYAARVNERVAPLVYARYLARMEYENAGGKGRGPEWVEPCY